MPTGDSSRLNEYGGPLSTCATIVASKLEQTVARAKASVCTSEDAELVAQCNSLENEVSPGVHGRADRLRDGQKDLSIACLSLASSGANVNDSLWT
jgi:hypothetical protein